LDGHLSVGLIGPLRTLLRYSTLLIRDMTILRDFCCETTRPKLQLMLHPRHLCGALANDNASLLSVFFLETSDATFRIDDTLFSSEEWMRVR
jgi:hypothetical protein